MSHLTFCCISRNVAKWSPRGVTFCFSMGNPKSTNWSTEVSLLEPPTLLSTNSVLKAVADWRKSLGTPVAFKVD